MARALECDEDKDSFEKSLGKIAAHKPEKDPPKKFKEPKKKTRQVGEFSLERRK